MSASIRERQIKAGILTFDPGSQLGSYATEFDPRTGEIRSAVVDGNTITNEDEAWRQAGIVYMRGIGGNVMKQRRWIFWRPSSRAKRAIIIGEK